ncbi:MAG: 4Fe-4S dicluster domain-containing protein [Ruminococcaceae bacterium]|nr:4Fe-4S dicluster domain-containing protein [Oscillospiraceae bacterium]
MLFEKVKKNFGFGFMRLPMIEKAVDYEQVNQMVDAFMEAGFNYFDTARVYLDGDSEIAIRECVAKRYPRESFVLANKLSPWIYNSEEEIRPLFESQLESCGVDYFDVYIFHCMNRDLYQKNLRCNSFETVKQLKEEGKVKHIAMSFHDTADVLDKILTEQPFIEFVQIQFNYLDYDDAGVQSKACYDVCRKHGKKVIVMEPVKGGTLVNLPKEAKEFLAQNSKNSEAEFAIRFAASFPDVEMVLSGMGNMDMITENIAFMKGFVPFSEEEMQLSEELRNLIRTVRQIPCTGCRYCVDDCPKKIQIPDVFTVYNKHLAAESVWEETKQILQEKYANVKDCIQCGVCEGHCPQNINIKETIKLLGESI